MYDKYLIINADDFGMSEIFNEAILDLIRNKLIFSTTAMVNRVSENQKSQFDELISLSKNRMVSVGLHLEFKNDDYLAQIEAQFQKFKEILGFEPSHIDIHKVHSLMNSCSYVAEFCKKNNLPLRNSSVFFDDIKTTSAEAFFGSIADFKKIVDWIKTFEDKKYYEILFHPGKFDPDCVSSLNKDRERDVEHIRNIHAILEENNIRLISYWDLADAP